MQLSLMEWLSGEFNEMKESLKELKEENSVLRREIMGIGALTAPADQMGLMENTTLRELVEEIQFNVKALNAKVERSLQEEEGSVKRNKSSADNGGENTEEPAQIFPVVDIQFKTIAEQRDCMNKILPECVKRRSVSEGATFGGRTVQMISSSIVTNPTERSTSCTLKLSNHLSYALTDPRFHFYRASKISGLSRVDPHVCDFFTFQGPTDWGSCEFLCSFETSSSLRLTFYSLTCCDGRIQFGVAFTPQDVPTDPTLYTKLAKISSVPDIWMHSKPVKKPLEVIINNGKLLARGFVTPGPFSVICIEVVEVSDTEAVPLPVHGKMKPLKDGESMSTTLTSRNLLNGSSSRKKACIVEIGNCLTFTLKNRNGFFCNNTHNYLLPSEILPFYRERFLASDYTTLEGIFSYEIEWTDLCLVGALRVESGNNSFAVAFAHLPVEANRNELEALMDPKAWKTHLYKKYAQAKDGEQVIEIRNIRASVKMTEDAESLLNIRVFAV